MTSILLDNAQGMDCNIILYMSLSNKGKRWSRESPRAFRFPHGPFGSRICASPVNFMQMCILYM